MKIRNGFVSNSSSSSFVIRLDKNKDKETQINDLLDRVIDVFDIEDETEYFITEKDICKEDYDDMDLYYSDLKDAYKNHVMKDLLEAFEIPMDKESIKEDIETAKTLDKIDFENSKLIHNSALLKYDWNFHGYEFQKYLAQQILDDVDGDYYNLWVSDHWNEDTNYDGYLETWLQYGDEKYVIDRNDHH